MNRDEIVATMVKARECCRQIVQLYEAVRDDGNMTKGGLVARRGSLAKANAALSQMLLQMKRLPEKPAACVSLDEDKQYVAGLFAEISELLEKAMILEREVRSCTPADENAPCRVHGARAMKAYNSD